MKSKHIKKKVMNNLSSTFADFSLVSSLLSIVSSSGAQVSKVVRLGLFMSVLFFTGNFNQSTMGNEMSHLIEGETLSNYETDLFELLSSDSIHTTNNSALPFINRAFASQTFSGLGGSNSGGSGFKTIDNIPELIVSNNMIHLGSEILGTTEVYTIKADGVVAESFDFNDLQVSNFNITATYTGSTIEFFDKNDDLLRTMNNPGSLTSPTVSINTLFGGDDLPISGVSKIVITLSGGASPSNFTLESIDISNPVAPSAFSGFQFTSDGGAAWDDGIAEDGEGGSADLVGLNIQIFNVDAALANIGEMEWYSDGDVGTANNFSGLTTFFAAIGEDDRWKGQIIKESGANEFQINSFEWYDWGNNNSQPMIVLGFRNAIEVASQTFTGNAGANSVTVNLSADFDYVDEVRIITNDANFTYPTINNIEIVAGVAPIDTDPPVFENSTPSQSSVAQTTFTLGTDIAEAGTIYYVVVANNATAPTSANVKGGESSGGGTAVTSGNAVVSSGNFTNDFSVTGLSAGIAYDVYVVAQDDEGTPNLQVSPTKIDVTTSVPTSATVAATAFIEGAYNGTNLNTTLNTSIPTTQPYNINGHVGAETVGSVPANAVDWVLVELREAASAATALSSTKVGSAAGFLMNDGTIKATDGTSNLTINLSGNTGADFFVVVYHRNHLPIISANAISESGSLYTIDFTSASANTHQGTTGLASLLGGKFAMIAGDANGDGGVNATDLTLWKAENGDPFSYSITSSDFNLDGEVNAVDLNDFQKKNNTKTSQVPTT